MAAVVALEQSRSPADLKRVVEALRRRRRRDESGRPLERAFAEWVWRLAKRLSPAGAPLPPVSTLEDLKMTLEERVSEWPRQWRQEGLEQGLEQQRALLRRLASPRFDAAPPTARRGCRPASPTPSASPRSATGSCSAERPTNCSPARVRRRPGRPGAQG